MPDESFYTFMADRMVLRQELGNIVRNLSRRPGASFHLIWSWLGSGKTHALHYMAHLCRTQYSQVLLPVYTEFPRSPRGFVDLYSSFISAVNLEHLSAACFDLKDLDKRSKLQKELEFVFPDLWNALKMLYIGDDEDKTTVSRWIRLEPEDLKRLKECGINRRLDRSEDALKVVAWVTRLLGTKAECENSLFRIVWMIDEYQRIEQLRTPARDDINGSLQSAFNRSPKSLSIFLSFSGKPEKKLPPWLSPEIADRIGAAKTLVLPPLTEDEAFVFIKDILSHFRDGSSVPPDPFFPFDERSVKRTIQLIKAKTELRPRRLMEGFNAVLQEGEIQIESGQLKFIGIEFAETQLKGLTFMGVDE